MAAGFFPLDGQLQLHDVHRSEGVLSDAVWLSGLVTFAEVEAILSRIGGIHYASSSVWRNDQRWGQRLGAVVAAEQAAANRLPALGEAPVRWERRRERMGVSLDGAMIPLRVEGWQELKVGSVFAVALRPEVDEQTGEMVELAHAVANSYVAHLGGPEAVGEQLWSEASRRGWEGAPATLAIGDGAPWIWNQVAFHFGDSQQLVDWYHAQEHLTSAAHTLKGEGTPAQQRWLSSRKTQLYQGHADRIADELIAAAATQPPAQAERLGREAAYFRTNQHRMNYLEMREEGWPIGSGMVESAAKQFKHRFCGPGMRWLRSGAEALIPIRCAILRNRFDELWTRAYSLPPN